MDPKVDPKSDRKTLEARPAALKVKAVGAPPPPKPGAMLDAGTRKIHRVKQADGQQATEGSAESAAAAFVVMHFAIKHE